MGVLDALSGGGGRWDLLTHAANLPTTVHPIANSCTSRRLMTARVTGHNAGYGRLFWTETERLRRSGELQPKGASVLFDG